MTAKRCRILFFLPSLEQGGAERQAIELISRLDRSRFECRLVVCNGRDEFGLDLGVGKPIVLNAPNGPTPLSLLKLIGVVRREKPDLLHSFMGQQNIHGRIATRVARQGKNLSSVLCMQLPDRYVKRELRTQWLVDHWMVNSRGIVDEMMARVGIERSRMTLIENGVDTNRFRPGTAEERDAARQELGLTGLVVTLPGRLAPQKNQVEVLKALGSLRRAGALPADLTVVFAGRRERSFDYDQEIEREIATQELADVVRMPGVISPMEKLLWASDAILLPSQFEGLPNAVLEAQSSALPVLVSPPANVDELVVHGDTGVTCSDTFAPSIEVALRELFALTADERRAMGARARAATEARFGVDVMVRRHEELYERIVATK